MKIKHKNIFKSLLALTLAFIMLLGAAPLSALAGIDFASLFAPKAEAAGKTDIIDYEVLKAQYIAGTKDYPESATVTGNTANDIYNYYIKDDIYSPSLDILNSVREDKALKAEMVAWEMYSLGGSPSSAIDKIMKGEDYCETLLLSALEKSLEDNNWTKALKSEVAGETKDLRDMFYDLCDVGDEITTAEDAKKAEEGLKQAVKKLYPDKTEKITGAIGYIIKYTKRITEIIQKVVAYSKLLDIDEYSKEWLAEMRLMNEQTVNDSDMRAALDRLIGASMNEDNFANVSLMLGVETTAKWILETGIKEGIKALCKGNPVVAAIFTGLSVVKTICNIFFATDDVCEQLYVMNKLETLQLLARGVARKAESNFVNTENNYYAQIFTKSVDLYFNLITEVDCDCMKEFLKNLYTGGYLKGVLVWLYNAKGDYESAVETLDSFQQTRRNNYNYMIKYCMIGLKLTSEQSYNYYFGNEAVEMTNDAWVISSPYFTLALRDGSPKYIEITGLKDKSLSYVDIPSKIGKYPVTKIADGVFAGNENINSAVIGNNVRTIGENAFNGCTNLKSVTIGDNVISIGYAAFEWCEKLENINIPAGITKIEDYVFCNCSNLKKINIPDGVTSIGMGAFEGSNITNIEIPDTVTSIGELAFSGCRSLKSVTMPDTLTSMGEHVFVYCTSLTSIEIPRGIKSIPENTFFDCANLRSVKIPDGVTCIGKFAFHGCQALESIKIPDSVTCIDDFAFCACDALKEVVMGKNVQKIGEEAFYHCTNLENIDLPNSLTEIGNRAFLDCLSFTSITIPDSVTSIGNEAFNDCTGITEAVIGNSVTSIGNAAFRGCTGLTSITIPDSVTSIGNEAFNDCTGITEAVIGNSVTSIGNAAFRGCTGLTSITIPDSVTSIGAGALSYCTSLKNITIDENNKNYLSKDGVLFNKKQTTLVQYPGGKKDSAYTISGGVVDIENWAFSGCTDLTKVVIDNGVKTIGDYAFSDCMGLANVIIGNGVTTIGDCAFERCTGLMAIYYLSTDEQWEKISIGKENYWTDSVIYESRVVEHFGTCGENLTWKLYADGSLVISGTGAMNDWISLSNVPWNNWRLEITNITISDGVTNIGNYAFCDCYNLTSITIHDGVTNIGDYAFCDCYNLTSITIPDSVMNIGNYAFDRTGLTSVTIPDGVISIGESAFSSCIGLKSITISDNVTNIGDYAFYDCTGLTDVVIGNGVTSIGDSAFHGCTGLKNITIPDSVANIGCGAFSYCTGITSVTIPDSITTIGYAAFLECTGLTDVYYSGTKAEWSRIVIDELNECLGNATIHYNGNPCTNHSWSDWTVTKPATAESEGLRERTCLVCGEKETEVIPKLDFIYGDVNGDGKINGRDAIKLAKYLAAYDEDKGESSVAVSPGADVNGDGKINGRDLVKLRKYLANYDESTGESSVKLGPGN